jgi:hypothetical protein
MVNKGGMGKGLLKLALRNKLLSLVVLLGLIATTLSIFSTPNIPTTATNSLSDEEKQALLAELSNSSPSEDVNAPPAGEGVGGDKEDVTPSADLENLERITLKEEYKPVTAFENDYYKVEVVDVVESQETLDVRIKYLVKEDIETNKDFGFGNEFIFISPNYTVLAASEGYLRMVDIEGKGLIDADKLWEQNKDDFIKLFPDKINKIPLEQRLPSGFEFEGILSFQKPVATSEKLKLNMTTVPAQYFIELAGSIGGWYTKQIAEDIKTVDSKHSRAGSMRRINQQLLFDIVLYIELHEE